VTDSTPGWAVMVDISTPSVPRMYDYFLGGHHNFEVDREAARDSIAAMPGVRAIARSNRAVLRRAVQFAGSVGITQFLDIGSGIPTEGNTHEFVQARNPEAVVVYVDHDDVAVAHSRALLEESPNTAIVKADLRDPLDILAAPETKRLIDFNKPVALMLVAILHFLEDRDKPAEIIAALRDVLAPGSVIVITHATEGPVPSHQTAVQEVYSRTATPLITRDVEDLVPFFAGFEMVPPGIVALPYWRPDDGEEGFDEAELHGLVGVGLKV
jgi:SAM-dependent methyltransferase